jgi:hypothetical protein
MHPFDGTVGATPAKAQRNAMMHKAIALELLDQVSGGRGAAQRAGTWGTFGPPVNDDLLGINSKAPKKWPKLYPWV